MKKVAISIPVHESPAVIYNQLKNIQKFVPNSVIILHSSGSSGSHFINEVDKIAKSFPDFAFVNPIHYSTYSPNDAGFVTGLSTVHSSNFQYLASQIKFDGFALNTSNDMFVRDGIEDIFNNFDCSFHVSMEDPANYPFQDVLEAIRPYVTVKTAEKGSQEGFFLPAEVFKDISKIILSMDGMVKAEEMYLPCLAFNLCPELYKKNSGEHYVYHNPAHYSVTKEDVHKTQYGEYGPKYAVKRVPRNINDPIRRYINEITGLANV